MQNAVGDYFKVLNNPKQDIMHIEQSLNVSKK